jgi:hypothetical protein
LKNLATFANEAEFSSTNLSSVPGVDLDRCASFCGAADPGASGAAA